MLLVALGLLLEAVRISHNKDMVKKITLHIPFSGIQNVVHWKRKLHTRTRERARTHTKLLNYFMSPI
jgi:hypothetical protein